MSARKVVRPTHAHYARLLRLLVERRRSVAELVELTGLKDDTVRGLLRALRASRLVHIETWEPIRRGGRRVPWHRWRPGAEDAPMLKPTSAQRAREWRRRRAELDRSGVHPRPGAVQ